MSQEEVYKILKELGGEATVKQIRLRAKKKFPKLTLHTYVHDRLKKLEKNQYIKRIVTDETVIWKIINDYP